MGVCPFAPNTSILILFVKYDAGHSTEKLIITYISPVTHIWQTTEVRYNKTMLDFLRKLKRAHYDYTPLIRIEISKEALLHNLNQFKRISPTTKIAPVLKSNAYGHGLLQVAEIMDEEDVPFLVVDSYFEALTLRRHGTKKSILIIGYADTHSIIANKLKNISFTITSMAVLRELASQRTECKLHLKIDTGMNRQGIHVDELEEALTILCSQPHLVLEGIMSHFADADSMDSTFTESQITKWNNVVEKVLHNIPTLLYYHLSATGGHHYASKIQANVSRVGLGLYGLNQDAPVDKDVLLKPAMKITTVITGIKHIKKGDNVGYSRTFTAPTDMTIATLPMGYFEGIDRRLSNKGVVKIGDMFAPILGRVSMNITAIDVTHIPQINLNDSVCVISDIQEDANSIYSISHMCATIPYEIAVHIPQHLLRVVV